MSMHWPASTSIVSKSRAPCPRTRRYSTGRTPSLSFSRSLGSTSALRLRAVGSMPRLSTMRALASACK
eukprot:177335-Pleurochrysis_carterae.AAC.1